MKKKYWKTQDKIDVTGNKLLDKIMHVHSMFSTDTDGTENTAPHIFDVNARKSAEADSIWYSMFCAGQILKLRR